MAVLAKAVNSVEADVNLSRNQSISERNVSINGKHTLVVSFKTKRKTFLLVEILSNFWKVLSKEVVFDNVDPKSFLGLGKKNLWGFAGLFVDF